jgi:hypothetical protein
MLHELPGVQFYMYFCFAMVAMKAEGCRTSNHSTRKPSLCRASTILLRDNGYADDTRVRTSKKPFHATQVQRGICCRLPFKNTVIYNKLLYLFTRALMHKRLHYRCKCRGHAPNTSCLPGRTQKLFCIAQRCALNTADLERPTARRLSSYKASSFSKP